jgi:SAM-dependent methyltransferase
MRRFTERHDTCRTDTQWVVQQSGYRWVLGLLGTAGNQTILDAACGTGFGTAALAEAGARAIGIDIALNALRRARRDPVGRAARYLAMDAMHLAFADAVFDGIVSQDTIEHLADDSAFLSEAARVLKPGGRLFLFTPFRKHHTLRPDNPYHLREYSPRSLQARLTRHFPSVNLFGRRSSAGLVRIEATLDEIRRRDPWGLRAAIPRSVRHALGSAWLKWRGWKPLGEVTPADVEYVEGVPDGCTTLVAVCRKAA